MTFCKPSYCRERDLVRGCISPALIIMKKKSMRCGRTQNETDEFFLLLIIINTACDHNHGFMEHGKTSEMSVGIPPIMINMSSLHRRLIIIVAWKILRLLARLGQIFPWLRWQLCKSFLRKANLRKTLLD